MNYASIIDWISLIRDTHLEVGNGQLFELPSTKEPEAFLSELSVKGVDYLKSIKPEDVCGESASYIWWLSQTLKKFEQGTATNEKDTIEGFRQRNAAAAGHCIPVRHHRRMKELLSRALSSFGDALETNDGRFGPGAVSERLDALQKWGVFSDFSYDPRLMTLTRGGAWSQIGPARLCCVPKTFSSLRLITVEPAEQSFGQQYVRRTMLAALHMGPLAGSVMDQSRMSEEELLYGWRGLEMSPDGKLASKLWGVDIWDPGHGGLAEAEQRKLCVKASRDARRATLDLKDASDSISWHQIVEVFPPVVVSYLERFRSEAFQAPGSKNPEKLMMFAGMGNATTFVVETLFFWAAVTSICEWLGDSTPVTVYGDDIICGNHAATHPLFEGALNEMGLRVNWTKSGVSATPGFRESCGVCAVAGHTMRELIRINGFDLQDPSSTVDACDFCNRVTTLIDTPEPDWRKPALMHLGDGLAKALHTSGVPSLGSFMRCSGGVRALSWHGIPFDSSLEVASVRSVNPEETCKPCYQHLAAKLERVEPVTRDVWKSHLSPLEALGVLHGSLETSHKLGDKKIRLRIPTRDVRLVRRWVPVAVS